MPFQISTRCCFWADNVHNCTWDNLDLNHNPGFINRDLWLMIRDSKGLEARFKSLESRFKSLETRLKGHETCLKFHEACLNGHEKRVKGH
jgi:hypothetical protein